MSTQLGVYTLAQGQQVQIPVDKIANGAVKLYNESGYLLQINIPGYGSDYLPAWTGDVWPLPSAFGSFITIIPQNISSQVQSPSSMLTATGYGKGEQISGTFPVSLARQVSVGNSVSTTSTPSIINDGNGPGTTIVESTPNDQGSSAFSYNNDGSGTRKILSAGVQRTVESVTRGNSGSTKAIVQLGDSGDETITTYYGKLDKINSDTAKIVSDGSGDLTLGGALIFGALPGGVSTTATQQGYLFASTGVNANVLTAPLNGVGAGGLLFATWNGSAKVNLFSLGGQFASAPAYIDNAGNVVAPGYDGAWHTPAATDRGFTTKDNAPNIEMDVLAPGGTSRGFLFSSYDGTNLHGCFEGTSNGVCRVGTNDPTLGNPRMATYIGTTDPAGRAGVTVQDGDVWIDA